MSLSRRLPGVLLDVVEADDLATLTECLRITPADERFHCMCSGSERLEVVKADGRVDAITLHHGQSIRWKGWSSDAMLADPERLIYWLADNGIPRPLQERRASVEEASRSAEAAARWLSAAPPGLEEVATLSMTEGGMASERPEVTRAGLEALRDRFSSGADGILGLLSWFGQGEGPWSGFPAYESFPSRLLDLFPADEVRRALQSELTTEQLEGAARYFTIRGGLTPPGGDGPLVPDALRVRLLEHMATATNQDNRRRAEAAFGRPARPWPVT